MSRIKHMHPSMLVAASPPARHGLVALQKDVLCQKSVGRTGAFCTPDKGQIAPVQSRGDPCLFP